MSIPGVEVTGGPVPGSDRILTDDALAFVADLQRRFKPLREDLLQRRHARDQAIRGGGRVGSASCRRRRRPAKTSGRSPPRRRISTTGGSRSPARPSRR